MNRFRNRFEQEQNLEDLIPTREGSEVTTLDGYINAAQDAINALSAGPGSDPDNAAGFQKELDALKLDPNAKVVKYDQLITRIRMAGAWDSGSETAK